MARLGIPRRFDALGLTPCCLCRPTRTFAREMPVFGASGIRSKYIRFQWFAEAVGGPDCLSKEAWDAKAGTRSGNFIWFGSDFEEAAFLGICGSPVKGLC